MIVSFSASSSTVLQHVAGSVKIISGHKNFPMYLLLNSNREKNQYLNEIICWNTGHSDDYIQQSMFSFWLACLLKASQVF